MVRRKTSLPDRVEQLIADLLDDIELGAITNEMWT